MLHKRSAALVAVAALTCVSWGFGQQDTPIKNTLKVNQNDLSAVEGAKSFSNHVTAARVEGAAARANAVNAAGAQQAREEMAKNLSSAAAAAAQAKSVPSPTASYFYPADLTKGTDPTYSITLGSTTQHAIYVDMTGSVASNFGNPEQFLSDLNWSTMIHLTDQYTGKTGNGRYPVGANAAATYSFYGNIIYEHELAAIAHAAAAKFGAGTGNVYHLFLPRGMDTCFDGTSICYSPDNFSTWSFCAYHTAWSFSDLGIVIFSVEPYQAVQGCEVAAASPQGQLADSTDTVLSHELIETITDPLPGYGYVNRSSLDLDGAEIGDECQTFAVDSKGGIINPVETLNGKKYAIQLEYSDRYHACAQQP